ncbi:putative ATP-grasp-modified RiPP [Streptosporangium sp. NPDC051022]|uniref:putative ATP-grasp-modified RiPP n=1 Tax=Streptosporangium sp. NPDC051022 TaxID=3155752 RepID=UPI00341B1CE6
MTQHTPKTGQTLNRGSRAHTENLRLSIFPLGAHDESRGDSSTKTHKNHYRVDQQETRPARRKESIMSGPISPMRPWGLSRMTPIEELVEIGYTIRELDPETQITRYFDQAGQPVKMGKHGTNRAVSSSKATGSGDGSEPTPPDDVTVTEYVPD